MDRPAHGPDPGLAATKTAKPGKGVDEVTCFSCHEEIKELKNGIIFEW